jgi:hypothetical protein
LTVSLLRPSDVEKEDDAMTSTWSPEQLQRLGASDELEIAVRRADGTVGSWVPIWVVCVGPDVFVRTWHRRSNGWFGDVLRSQRARIRVAHVCADVTVTDVGEDSTDLRAGVDNAYHSKYSRYGDATVDRMVSDPASATTLRLMPE